MTSHDRHPDEETPLLQTKSKAPTTWDQLCLIFLAMIAEPISSTYIFPFVIQLVGELGITGGDDRKIGYYAGSIESVFFATQALFSWRWSQLSDSIGRRPVVLLGLLGLSVSNFAFGLSRSLGALIISRGLAGLLNGNVGVMRGMIGDITDHTNMARAYAFVPAVFFIGATIAPLYGGALIKPQEQWPGVFRGKFWETYPYFLPSLVSGCSTLSICLLCAAFLKESLPSKADTERLAAEQRLGNTAVDNDRPTSILALMKTYSVMIIVSNFGMLGLMEICFLVLSPLFYSSPIAIGGLGLPPSIIGIYLATFGMVNCAIQAFGTAKIIEWVGPQRLFRRLVYLFYPLILNFPIMSAVATAQGKVGPVIWILLAFQLVFMVLIYMCFAILFMLTTRAAPNKRSLGTVHGLGQSVISTVRAIGPVMTTSLFAFSKQYNVIGGNFVYVVLAVFATILVLLSRRLPEEEDGE